MALVEGLPPDSALNRAAWTTDNELRAVAIDRSEQWWWMWLAMNAKEPGKLPPPITIAHPDRPEPERQPRKKAVNDPAQLARVLGGR